MRMNHAVKTEPCIVLKGKPIRDLRLRSVKIRAEERMGERPLSLANEDVVIPGVDRSLRLEVGLGVPSFVEIATRVVAM